MQKFWKFLDLCYLSVHKVTWYVWAELASHKTCLMKCIFHDWLTPAAGRLALQLSFPPDKVLAQRISCFFGIASNVSSKQAHGKIDQMKRMNGQEKFKRPENDGLRILLWGDQMSVWSRVFHSVFLWKLIFLFSRKISQERAISLQIFCSAHFPAITDRIWDFPLERISTFEVCTTIWWQSWNPPGSSCGGQLEVGARQASWNWQLWVGVTSELSLLSLLRHLHTVPAARRCLSQESQGGPNTPEGRLQ